MKLLYFAWVRQKIGRSEETMALPAHVVSVGDLLDHLSSRAPEYREAFKDTARLRCAVNQIHCDFAHPINEGDEIAFFPPVTGG